MTPSIYMLTNEKQENIETNSGGVRAIVLATQTVALPKIVPSWLHITPMFHPESFLLSKWGCLWKKLKLDIFRKAQAMAFLISQKDIFKIFKIFAQPTSHIYISNFTFLGWIKCPYETYKSGGSLRPPHAGQDFLTPCQKGLNVEAVPPGCNLKGGTVSSWCILNGGTVPPGCILIGGTVPPFNVFQRN